ncbi:MAG TPA: tetratricopeptide repeat protein, partial [Bacteroidia bacterium]|nr:tetratricopeptide repeat protein [Bacteroidia bacterium]
VQMNHLYDDDLWQKRCLYEYQRYEDAYFKDLLYVYKKRQNNPNAYVNDSKLKSGACFSSMLLQCTLATLYCSKQEIASLILHEYVIAPKTDTTISDDMQDQFNKAGQDYDNSNYGDARRQYEKLVRKDSTYFKATNRVGLCYYKTEDYDNAIIWFKKAIALQPLMIEPRVSLVRCYKEEHKWDDAYNACIDGIIVYPDDRLFMLLDETCDKLGKTFDRHFMPRDYIPNMANNDDQGSIDESPWSFYRMAKDKIMDYCDKNGVITRTNDVTKQGYLESFSWEYMLQKSTPEGKEFPFAKKMMNEGYIDCYSMVSLFHITMWDQYHAFSQANADRIRTYITTYLVK